MAVSVGELTKNMEENKMKTEKFINADLINGYYDEVNNTYDLEFNNGWLKNIPGDEHPDASEDEYYWDNQSRIDEAMEQGEVTLSDEKQ